MVEAFLGAGSTGRWGAAQGSAAQRRGGTRQGNTTETENTIGR